MGKVAPIRADSQQAQVQVGVHASQQFQPVSQAHQLWTVEAGLVTCDREEVIAHCKEAAGITAPSEQVISVVRVGFANFGVYGRTPGGRRFGRSGLGVPRSTSPGGRRFRFRSSNSASVRTEHFDASRSDSI